MSLAARMDASNKLWLAAAEYKTEGKGCGHRCFGETSITQGVLYQSVAMFSVKNFDVNGSTQAVNITRIIGADLCQDDWNDRSGTCTLRSTRPEPEPYKFPLPNHRRRRRSWNYVNFDLWDNNPREWRSECKIHVNDCQDAGAMRMPSYSLDGSGPCIASLICILVLRDLFA